MKGFEDITRFVAFHGHASTRMAGALVLTATLGAASTRHVAHAPPGVTTTSSIRVILRGAQQGSLFTSNCGASSNGEFQVHQFTDLTSTNAPAGVGTFSLTIPATCVAPLLTALFRHEAVNGAIGFFAADGTPSLAFSLANAYVAHVSTSIDASSQTPSLTMDLVSPSWTASVPTSSAGGAWANPPAATSPSAPASAPASASSITQSSAPLSALRSGVLRTTVSPVAIAPRKIFGVDLEALRTHRARLGAVIATSSSSTSGGGSVFRSPYVNTYISVTLVGSQTAFPSPTFQGRDFGFDVHATLGAHGESTGAPAIALLPMHAAVTGAAAALMNAAQHHEPIQHATITVSSGVTGQPILTVVPHAPVLTGDHVVTASNVATQEVTLSLAGMTVTDVIAGRTAVSSP